MLYDVFLNSDVEKNDHAYNAVLFNMAVEVVALNYLLN